MTIEIRPAKNKTEIEKGYQLAAKIFGPNYFEAQATKEIYQTFDPVEDSQDVILVLNANEVIGFSRIVNRSVLLGGRSLKVGGITGVCIHPEFRSKKYSLKIMEASLLRSQQREDALSILFARRSVDGFYGQFGYLGLGCHPEMTCLSKSSYLKEKLPIELKTGVNLELLSFYSSCYHASYHQLPMSFERSSAWWSQLQERILLRIKKPENFVTVLHLGQPVGYFVVSEEKVIEAACSKNLELLVGEGIFSFYQQKEKPIVLALPVNHWAMRIFTSLNHTLKIRYSWDGGHMVRLLNASKFKEVIEPFGVPMELKPDNPIISHQQASDQMRAFAGLSGSIAETPTRNDRTNSLNRFPVWSILDEF